MLIRIYADNSSLNQLPVKNLFFKWSSKHFAINTKVLFVKKQLIWVFESRKSVHYWWSYISFAPEFKELTCMLDPLLYRWGVPPVVIRCVHRTMRRGVVQTWITPQSPTVVMEKLLHKYEFHGIHGELLSWIRSFLSMRTQSVVVEGCCSPEDKVLSGVPQGTTFVLVPHKWPI